MKKACVFLADGFEEIEGLTVVDILRRAGVEVQMVSIMDRLEIQGAHGIEIKADEQFDKVDFSMNDMLVLPGGMPGTLHLGKHEGLRKLILSFHEEEKNIAAICAAPSVLGKAGVLKHRKACCYPSFEEQLEGAEVVFEPVVRDGHLVTSRGMGTAIPFALKLVEVLCGVKIAEEVQKSILFA